MDRKIFNSRQMCQRNPKGFGHLAGINLRRKRAGNKPNHGRDGKAGDRFMRRKAAQYLDVFRIEANLLLCLAQRGRVNMGSLCVNFSTGGSDLIRVML